MILLENTAKLANQSGFMKGLKDGLPIGLGYFPVALACGIMAAKVGIPFKFAELLSLLIYSASGQVAVQNLYAGMESSILMYALTIFVMNCRYILFSVSIAQKFDKSMGVLQRIIFGFFNADEIYVLAMKQQGELGAPYLFGIAVCPYLGFLIGNTAGVIFTNFLPKSIISALGIMIYAMFIALIIPPAKHSKPVAIVTLIALCMSFLMECIPAIKSNLGPGITIIICAVVTATIGAIVFPVKQEDDVDEGGTVNE